MQIDIPQDLVDRLRHLTAMEKLESEAQALRKALDALEADLRDARAIQEGIDACARAIFKNSNSLMLSSAPEMAFRLATCNGASNRYRSCL